MKTKLKKPRTIEEKLAMRDVFTFHKGKLVSKKTGHRIMEAGISVIKNGLSIVKWYKVPFTESQAREVCANFGHIFTK